MGKCTSQDGGADLGPSNTRSGEEYLGSISCVLGGRCPSLGGRRDFEGPRSGRSVGRRVESVVVGGGYVV